MGPSELHRLLSLLSLQDGVVGPLNAGQHCDRVPNGRHTSPSPTKTEDNNDYVVWPGPGHGKHLPEQPSIQAPQHLQVPWLLTQNLDPPAPHCLPYCFCIYNGPSGSQVHLGWLLPCQGQDPTSPTVPSAGPDSVSWWQRPGFYGPVGGCG